MISDCAHLVLPYHRALDEQRELKKGKGKIGTTKRGIGPAYGDKAARVGLRMADLLQPELFTAKLKQRMAENNAVLKALGAAPLNLKAVTAAYLEAGRALAPFVGNTVVYMHEALKAGREMLFEGAQGTFLDIDHGTYPYVTSSNTTAGGACTGAGVPPTRINGVVGVSKAYITRVGGGPFPTEDHTEMGERIRAAGKEFGAVTGRPRRCGWFDVPLLQYTTAVNGFDSLIITKLDVLDELETIPVCVAYEVRGKVTTEMPATVRDLADAKPVYETMPGWQSSTEGISDWNLLPQAARNYVEFLEKHTGVEAGCISTGPERTQTVVRVGSKFAAVTA
jgi:adenylosuccinate synthase